MEIYLCFPCGLHIFGLGFEDPMASPWIWVSLTNLIVLVGVRTPYSKEAKPKG